MHFSKIICIKVTLMLFIIIPIGLLHAANPDIYSNKIIKFEVNPLVCIVEKIGDQCHLDAKLHWKTNQLLSICLMQENTIIQCWDDEKEIEEKLALYLKETTTFTMADRSNKIMASIIIMVNAIEPKKRRRRLRSAWGLF